MLKGVGEILCGCPDRVVLVFGAGIAPAPVFARAAAIEQPLDSSARRRIQYTHRVEAPASVDQQGADTAADFAEIGRGLAPSLAKAAILAGEFVLFVPQDEP